MDNPISRREFIEETDKIRTQLTKHDRQIVVLETLINGMKDLPDAITKLDKTMALISQNLEVLNGKVDSVVRKAKTMAEHNKEQDAEITALDNKSKVDIMDFLRANWWKIIVSGAAFVALLKSFMPV